MLLEVFGKSTKVKSSIRPTVLIRPNLTESKPQLNPGFTFWVYSGFTRVDPE